MTGFCIILLLASGLGQLAFCLPHPVQTPIDDHQDLYNSAKFLSQAPKYNEQENTKEYWYEQGEAAVEEKLKAINNGVAKNVIMFLGDGMSIATLTATRVYVAHQSGSSTGAEFQLSFEKFPHIGLAKTYCVNYQVPDSACTATAYLGGVKANVFTVGVTAAVPLNGCEEMNDPANHVDSLTRLSQLAGKRTGVVTTTRLTHASPAGTYGHTAQRKWECDTDVAAANKDPAVCHDLALQLVHGETGSEVNVYLGGGYGKFVGKSHSGLHGESGLRSDERNLIKEWQDSKENKEASNKVVTNRDELLSVPSDTEYVLGVFDNSHLPYNLERNATEVPSLTEMTETAIKLLSSNEKGYFLFVEGGLIDTAHHLSKARLALDEASEFHKAVEAAVRLTNSKDTLIVVTSDHAHAMGINGYPVRGNDILGLAMVSSIDKLPFTTLSYTTGPGYRKEVNGKRRDLTNEDLSDYNMEYPGLFPLGTSAHGGDDVGIFADGPHSHLFNGVNEQSYIAHAIKYASCLGDKNTACTKA